MSGFGGPKGSLGGSLLEVFLQSVRFSRKRLSILNDSTAFLLDLEGSVFPETSKIEQKLSLEIPCFFNSEKKFPGAVFLDFGVHFGVSFGALGSSFSQLLGSFFKV